MVKKTLVAAAAISLSTFALSSCGSDSDAASGPTAAATTARSRWASPRSAPRAAGAPPTPSPSRSRPRPSGVDLKFSDAQQKQENQIQAIRSFIQQRVDVIAFSPVVETGWDAVLQEAKARRHPGDPHRPRRRHRGHVALQDLPRLGLRRTRARRPATGWSQAGRRRAPTARSTWSSSRAPPAPLRPIDRATGFADAIAANPKIKIDRLADRRLHPRRRQEGHGGLPQVAADGIDLVFAHNDDMGLGAIEAIEAAGKRPGKDIKIVSIDAVKDGMQALADGKINYIVECNPLLGDAADGPGQEGRGRRGRAEPRVVTQDEHVRPGAGQGRAARPRSTDPRAPVAGQLRRGRSPAAPRGAVRHSPEGSMPMTCQPTTETPQPVVEMRDITIRFPGVLALDGVDFALCARRGARADGRERRRQVHPDQGADRRLRDRRGHDHGRRRGAACSPARRDAQDAGISRSTRRSTSARTSRSRENIMLGREPRRLGADRLARDAPARAASTLAQPRPRHRPARRCSASHPIAVQQLVAIGRAIVVDAAVLILDEPTSSLDADEVERALRASSATCATQGVAILFVSPLPRPGLRDRRPHHGPAQRPAGRRVPRSPSSPAARAGAAKMIGRELDVLEALDREAPTRHRPTPATPLLQAIGLGRKGVARAVRPRRAIEGEVVGIAGLLGSGRTELARLLFGADRADTGERRASTASRTAAQPARTRSTARIAFSSENRKAEGIVGDLTVARQHRARAAGPRGWLRRIPQADAGRRWSRSYIEALDIRPGRPRRAVPQPLGRQPAEGAARPLAGHRSPSCSSSTSRPAASTSAPRPRSSARSPSSPRRASSVVFISAELEEVLRLSDRSS